jgi:hypothetical protein
MMPQLFILMKLFREQNPIHHGARGAKRFLLCDAALLILSQPCFCAKLFRQINSSLARAHRELSNRELLLM